MAPGAAPLPRLLCVALLMTATAGTGAQSRSVNDMIAGLASDDAAARARAACELKAEGDLAVDAIAPLVRLLGDASPVERSVCRQHWWRNSDLLTTPGEQAAAALVSIGSRAYEPIVAALQQPQWAARRNAAWALGALDDSRAVKALVTALKDREAGVRAQAAWALGALDDSAAIEPLTAALKDDDGRVRGQAAWALGAIGDSRATAGLIVALRDSDASVRRHAAWALGAIGK
jgi:bilin biosynthesis protein